MRCARNALCALALVGLGCEQGAAGAGTQAPARASPSRAQSALRAELGLPPAPADALPPLTTCEVYALGEEAPRYRGRIDEGSIAPYGILLAAGLRHDLASALLAARAEGLWEYSPGYGPTAPDSAMVLEGLLAAGVDERVLIESLERMQTRYHDGETGALRALQAGRAAYWSGPDLETTAHVGELMQRIAPQRFARHIARATRFVLRRQRADGGWDGRWFASRVMATHLATRLLEASPPPHPEALARAASFVTSLQRSDGSVDGAVMETALAALVLRRAGAAAPAHRATRWLREHDDGARTQEAFLYYWFETAPSRRMFFTCRDRGLLSAAWKRLALAAAEPSPPSRRP